MKKLVLTLLTAFICLLSFAQNEPQNQGAFEKTMRSDGKIYVVVAVCLTILTGLIIYLVRLDKKMTKIEKSAGK